MVLRGRTRRHVGGSRRSGLSASSLGGPLLNPLCLFCPPAGPFEVLRPGLRVPLIGVVVTTGGTGEGG